MLKSVRFQHLYSPTVQFTVTSSQYIEHTPILCNSIVNQSQRTFLIDSRVSRLAFGTGTFNFPCPSGTGFKLSPAARIAFSTAPIVASSNIFTINVRPSRTETCATFCNAVFAPYASTLTPENERALPIVSDYMDTHASISIQTLHVPSRSPGVAPPTLRRERLLLRASIALPMLDSYLERSTASDASVVDASRLSDTAARFFFVRHCTRTFCRARCVPARSEIWVSVHIFRRIGSGMHWCGRRQG